MNAAMMIRIGFAITLNLSAAVWALRRGSVSPSGAAAGFIAGSGIFAAGGVFLWSLLMVFFLSGSALNRVGEQRKMRLETLHEKGSRRDGVQVMANGGTGLLSAVLFAISGQPVFAVACAVSFSAANADTWASEIGFLSRAQPVSIISGRPLPAGTSGGVTLLGITAAAGGAAVIAATFALGWYLRYGGEHIVILAAVVTAAGVAGSIIDSVLGATVQAHYADTITGAVTERRRNRTTENRLIRGIRGFDNDTVNAASCLLATVAGLAVAARVL